MDDEVEHSRTHAEARLDLLHHGRKRHNFDRAQKVRVDPRQILVASSVGNGQGAVGVGVGGTAFELDPEVGDVPLLGVLA